jgi:DNA modification methylase
MINLHLGDSLEIAKTLPSGSVQTIVTSPPYWNLRDYGTARWDGGDADCDHKSPTQTRGNIPHTKQATNNHGEGGATWTVCGKCGATRIDAQLGLERTPEEYVCHLVELFRELRRVLRDDGTLWLNLGDSYAREGSDNYKAGPGALVPNTRNGITRRMSRPPMGLKHKDLCGIPWRVAFALQADGWYLRSDIIWHKPNPMPESVTDRPTKAHEYIFLLSKSSKYYYDADAVKEPAAYDGRKDEMHKGSIKNYAGVMPNGQPQSMAQGAHPRWNKDENGNRVRNKRSVWTISTKPYKGAHFATFPKDLIAPCILAGAPVGGVVLDPFTGSGTTGLVSVELGRSFVGMELNPEYHAMATARIESAQAPLPYTVSVL